MRTVAVIQARLGSSRLPGKILMSIAGKPMLTHVIERTKVICNIDAVAVTIPDNTGDYRIYDLCEGCYVSIGPEDNVLRRYQIAADVAGADRIVRVTSDCPFLDPYVAESVIRMHDLSGADYVSNVWPTRTWPDGLDVEVFTRKALDELHAPDEHVTTWLRRPDSPCLESAVIDLGRLKWSVDTRDDLEFANEIMRRLDPGAYRMTDTMNAIVDAGLWKTQPVSQDWLKSKGLQ